MKRLALFAALVALPSLSLADSFSHCREDQQECREGCTLEFGTSVKTRSKLGLCLNRCTATQEKCVTRVHELARVEQDKAAADARAKELAESAPTPARGSDTRFETREETAAASKPSEPSPVASHEDPEPPASLPVPRDPEPAPAPDEKPFAAAEPKPAKPEPTPTRSTPAPKPDESDPWADETKTAKSAPAPEPKTARSTPVPESKPPKAAPPAEPKPAKTEPMPEQKQAAEPAPHGNRFAVGTRSEPKVEASATEEDDEAPAPLPPPAKKPEPKKDTFKEPKKDLSVWDPDALE